MEIYSLFEYLTISLCDVIATECQYYNFIIRFGNDYSLSKAVINVLRIVHVLTHSFLMHF